MKTLIILVKNQSLETFYTIFYWHGVGLTSGFECFTWELSHSFHFSLSNFSAMLGSFTWLPWICPFVPITFTSFFDFWGVIYWFRSRSEGSFCFRHLSSLRSAEFLELGAETHWTLDDSGCFPIRAAYFPIAKCQFAIWEIMP